MTEQFLTYIWNLIMQFVTGIGQIGTVPFFTVISGIVGIIGFFLKRQFANVDYDKQQKIQHSGRLLKLTVSYAEKHYTHLARCIINLRQELDKAKKTKNLQIIQYAYLSTVKFVEQYLKFEKETGANFLFIERTKEMSAVSQFQALFFSLPFDRNDIENMDRLFTSRQFQSFHNWILSTQCNNSKTIASKNLKELQGLLDLQSEKILHYDEFLRSIRIIKATRNTRKIKEWLSICYDYLKRKEDTTNVFYILGISPKYVKPGSNIVIFGKGFIDKVEEKRRAEGAKITGNEVNKKPKKTTDKIDSYKLFMNNISLQKHVLDNNSVEVTIPSDTPVGAYDITANFEYKNKPGDEPMGIVVHIIQ